MDGVDCRLHQMLRPIHSRDDVIRLPHAADAAVGRVDARVLLAPDRLLVRVGILQRQEPVRVELAVEPLPARDDVEVL